MWGSRRSNGRADPKLIADGFDGCAGVAALQKPPGGYLNNACFRYIAQLLPRQRETSSQYLMDTFSTHPSMLSIVHVEIPSGSNGGDNAEI